MSVVALQHDLLPHTNPDWFDPNLVRVFNRHLGAVARYADLVLCNSRHTRDELVAYCRGLRIEPPAMQVVSFGADIAGANGAPDTELLATLDGRRVVLSVGTLEPRKNQAVLLDAFDRIADRYPDAVLVLVGRQGWRIDELAERIRHHPDFGNRILWPGRVDDPTLDELYRTAVVTVVPSFSEGFGLPVLEALGRGGAVISSSGGALPEAGGEAADYFDPEDVDQLARLLDAHLGDEAHHAAAVERARSHVAPRWDDTAAEVAAAITRIGRRTR